MLVGRPRADDNVGGWSRGLVGVNVDELNDDDDFDGDDDEVSPYNIDDQTDFWHHQSFNQSIKSINQSINQ